MKKNYVLDTNIILNDVNNLFKISQKGENDIFLPETVLDEIDKKKTGFDEINFQAREFTRIFKEATVIEKIKKILPNKKEITIVKLSIEKTLKVNIISLSRYDSDDSEIHIKNDRKILESIQELENLNKTYNLFPDETVFLTLDGMCYIRAVSLDIKTESLTLNGEQEEKLVFVKKLKLDLHPADLNGKNILDIDPDYKPYNFCYILENEHLNKTLVTIRNGIINIVDNSKNTGIIKPRNTGQEFALSALMDPAYDVCIIEALAGSGKNVIATSAAMKNLDNGWFDKIVYIRNSIESTDKGEEVGFLSGNEEKFKIYNYPLYDTLDFIARESLKKSNKNKEKHKREDSEDAVKDKVDRFVAKYNIETMWVGEIRGRTITNAYVILDEAQNLSKKSMRTIISRLDQSCKIVVIGSNRQIDNNYINKHTNGLSVLLNSTKLEDHGDVSIFSTKLDQVERGKIAEWAEKKVFD